MMIERTNMPTAISGLHHVTAIASDPQRNLDFYTTVLGLRFVKRTVNFDDPGSYHFYFGDDTGNPGTILTFFLWPGAHRGSKGAGEVHQTTFSVPALSLEYWERRLRESSFATQRESRFGTDVLRFDDPDGMTIELAGDASAEAKHAPRYASVPAEHSIRGFSAVTLVERSLERTAALLNLMGFRQVGQEDSRIRFQAQGDSLGNIIDVVVSPDARQGRSGAGTVHHIACRASDDSAQLEWHQELSKRVSVTPVQDRTYFHSIYFREPGGVLFELATDPPGFLIDETVEALGEALRLPAWLERQHEQIAHSLPAISLHKSFAAL